MHLAELYEADDPYMPIRWTLTVRHDATPASAIFKVAQWAEGSYTVDRIARGVILAEHQASRRFCRVEQLTDTEERIAYPVAKEYGLFDPKRRGRAYLARHEFDSLHQAYPLCPTFSNLEKAFEAYRRTAHTAAKPAVAQPWPVIDAAPTVPPPPVGVWPNRSPSTPI